jgi:hypothetical protein
MIKMLDWSDMPTSGAPALAGGWLCVPLWAKMMTASRHAQYERNPIVGWRHSDVLTVHLEAAT